MSEIVGIRTDTINVPGPHQHIIAVKFADDDRIYHVGEVIEDAAEHYMVRDGLRLPLHVHRCHICGAYPYLTA